VKEVADGLGAGGLYTLVQYGRWHCHPLDERPARLRVGTIDRKG
jgi:hypothetical protein